jgi:hypothetical protein
MGIYSPLIGLNLPYDYGKLKRSAGEGWCGKCIYSLHVSLRNAIQLTFYKMAAQTQILSI